MVALRLCAILSTVLLLPILPTAAQAEVVQGQPIYVHNKTDRPVYVACSYLPPGTPDATPPAWATSGLWKIEPGQKTLILYNHGRYIYFGATDYLGTTWEGKDKDVYLNLNDPGLSCVPFSMGLFKLDMADVVAPTPRPKWIRDYPAYTLVLVRKS